MLAGIRTGKKKKPQKSAVSGQQTTSTTTAASATDDNNTSIADQLRLSLAAGIDPPKSKSLRGDLLERRGRIQTSIVAADDNGAAFATTLVTTTGGTAGAVGQKDASIDGTVQELLAEEVGCSQSNAEVEARNVFRRGKRRRHFKEAKDSDEEEERQQLAVFGHQSKRRDKSARAAAGAAPPPPRDRQGQQEGATTTKTTTITSMMASACWWWMESGRFPRYRLLALGNHVSMVLAPSSRSLIPGEHVFLVPIAHVPSLTACEDDVWDEIVRFQASLRRMCAKSQKAVVFYETVLPHHRGVWQTRLDAVMIPASQNDAPMYFKSALTEQAEEWGTHQKLLRTARVKDLRRTIPKNFPYFYVEYDDNGNGYVQLIEGDAFPQEFGIDTIGGMLRMDPIRFRRSTKDNEGEERRLVLAFLEQWKSHDWTVQLDDDHHGTK
jgi:Protein similar to CwfJ C-terminus 2/Protein similar to CwfJ C-terminus 1